MRSPLDEYEDEFDIYGQPLRQPVKRKAKPRPVYGTPPKRPTWRSACWLMALMLIALAGGAIIAFYVLEDDGGVDSESLRVQITVTASDTPSQTPSPMTPSATVSPTQTSISSETPSPTPSHTPTHTPSPTFTPRPIRGGTSLAEFLVDVFDAPDLIRVHDINCETERTTLTLTFDPQADENIPYYEILIEANGRDAALDYLNAETPSSSGPVIEAPMALVMDESSSSLINVADTTIPTVMRELWRLEQRLGVSAFSVTWWDTAEHTPADFSISGMHPPDGGLRITVRWEINGSASQAEDLLICR